MTRVSITFILGPLMSGFVVIVFLYREYELLF
jgi:hypothetical protein